MKNLGIDIYVYIVIYTQSLFHMYITEFQSSIRMQAMREEMVQDFEEKKKSATKECKLRI